jgi:hypothetical protein
MASLPVRDSNALDLRAAHATAASLETTAAIVV